MLSRGSRNFSSCSADDFENLVLNGGGNCLRNPPKTSNVYKEPVCGNNVIDNDEECDCGKPQVMKFSRVLVCYIILVVHLICVNTWGHFCKLCKGKF